MNSPQNKIFVFFGYWPTLFGVLQTCCKIQKCKKIILLCLRNPCENTFSKRPTFFIWKEHSKHVRVLVVCNTQKHFYIFLLSRTQTFHLITIKVKKKKLHISQILKALINQLLNPKKYIETCSYIFIGNTIWFYLSLKYLIICKLKH